MKLLIDFINTIVYKFKEVLKYCFYDEVGFFDPSIKEIMNYKFVLATCSMAGKLYNLGIELEHFDIIIIDEAGEATEPEALAAFSSLISKEG